MSHCPECPTQTIVDPPVTLYENYYHPQTVHVIHPIEIIKQHHCVPVPQHIYTYTTKDEYCNVSSLMAPKKDNRIKRLRYLTGAISLFQQKRHFCAQNFWLPMMRKLLTFINWMRLLRLLTPSMPDSILTKGMKPRSK
jgi:hypothetical protein